MSVQRHFPLESSRRTSRSIHKSIPLGVIPIGGRCRLNRWASVRRASLEELPLTPEERAAMERWRRG